MVIMCCQAMYVLETETVNIGDVDECLNQYEYGCKIVNKPTSIHIVN